MSATSDEPAERLRIEDPAGVLREVPLVPGQTLRLGRTDEAEVRLDGPGVSRVHAEVVEAGGRWVVRDAGSRNGIHTEAGPVDEASLDAVRPVALAGFLLRLGTGEADADAGADPSDDLELTITQAEAGAGRVGVVQLAALRALAERLRVTEPAEARREALVAALVEPGFGAWHAGVLTEDLLPPAQKASSPFAAAPWRVSRSAVAAARARGEPVLATPAGSGAAADPAGSSMGVAVEQSLVETPEAASGVLVLPLEDGDEPLLLYVMLPAAHATADWLALGVLVADAAAAAEAGWAQQAAAVDAARLNQDLARARAVQHGLLPDRLDLDPRLDVSTHYRACHGVGGDHLDALAMPDGRMLFLVADVCGKGIQAALVSASVRTYVRAVVPTGPTLLGLVNGLNRHLVQALPAGRFVTAVFAAVDPATGGCEMVHAGHPRAIVAGPGGEDLSVPAAGDEAAADEGCGLPLGVADDAMLEPVSLRIPAGGRLLLYSDGLSELMRGGRWLGTDGLLEVFGVAVDGAADRGSKHVAEALVRGLDELANAEPADDDQAFVLVRRAG